jgi:purine-binding chemotaxis protein CheW
VQNSTLILTIQIDDIWLGLLAAEVTRVCRAVEVTPVSEAPPYMLGVVVVAGEPVPVFDLRWLLHLPPRAVRARDFLAVARVDLRPFALVASRIGDTLSVQQKDLIKFEDAVAGRERQMIQLEDRLIVIDDFISYVSHLDYEVLKRALPEASMPP